jgi:pyruvate ferredoxin oxidoreductase gamma subunit
VGLSLQESLAGLDAELTAAHLSLSQREANVHLAEAAYALVQPWAPVQEYTGAAPISYTPVIELAWAPATQAAPSVYAIANSPERQTGSWRQFRPVLQRERCSRCWVCFVRCPDAAITLDSANYPVVDLDACKGCLLCVHECPTHAFSIVRESR